MPWARYWLIRSISTIALVTTMPTSMSMPISAGTPSAVPVTSSSDDRAGRGERDRHQQDQRLDQAAERRRHDQEHDRDRGQQRQAEVAERVGLVGAHAAEAVGRPGRQRRAPSSRW